jgi:hypothetical protein
MPLILTQAWETWEPIPRLFFFLKGRTHLFWLSVLEVHIHHGGEGVVEDSSSHHDGQEVEEMPHDLFER